MIGVFSPAELQTIRSWINSLPPSEDARIQEVAKPAQATESQLKTTENRNAARRTWSRSAFSRRSRQRYAGCSVRELYYYLVNVEFFPDVLPAAERFARDWLERAACTIRSGRTPQLRLPLPVAYVWSNPRAALCRTCFLFP